MSASIKRLRSESRVLADDSKRQYWSCGFALDEKTAAPKFQCQQSPGNPVSPFWAWGSKLQCEQESECKTAGGTVLPVAAGKSLLELLPRSTLSLTRSAAAGRLQSRNVAALTKFKSPIDQLEIMLYDIVDSALNNAFKRPSRVDEAIDEVFATLKSLHPRMIHDLAESTDFWVRLASMAFEKLTHVHRPPLDEKQKSNMINSSWKVWRASWPHVVHHPEQLKELKALVDVNWTSIDTVLRFGIMAMKHGMWIEKDDFSKMWQRVCKLVNEKDPRDLSLLTLWLQYVLTFLKTNSGLLKKEEKEDALSLKLYPGAWCCLIKLGNLDLSEMLKHGGAVLAPFVQRFNEDKRSFSADENKAIHNARKQTLECFLREDFSLVLTPELGFWKSQMDLKYLMNHVLYSLDRRRLVYDPVFLDWIASRYLMTAEEFGKLIKQRDELTGLLMKAGRDMTPYLNDIIEKNKRLYDGDLPMSK
jgi:hypothetical protein